MFSLLPRSPARNASPVPPLARSPPVISGIPAAASLCLCRPCCARPVQSPESDTSRSGYGPAVSLLPLRRWRRPASSLASERALHRPANCCLSDSGCWFRPPSYRRASCAPPRLLLLRNRYHPFVDVPNHLRPQGQRPLVHDGVVGNFAAAHPREGTVDQVGAHLALHHFIAPVADVLEQEQSQNDFGRRAQPAAGPAFGAPSLGTRWSAVDHRP